MSKPGNPTKNRQSKLTIFQKISLAFFNRPRISAVIFLVIMASGIVSYTTLLKREGFPSINVPFSLASGAYIVNDPSKVDHDIGQPFSDIIAKQDGVKRVDAQSNANFYSIAIEYKEGTDVKVASAKVEQAVKAANVLPQNATAKFEPLSIGVDERGDDMLVAFYSTSGKANTKDLYDAASKAAGRLTKSGDVALAQTIEAIDPFVHGTDPVTGQPSSSQKVFDRFSIRENQTTKSYESVSIGIKGVKGFDVLELDKQVRDSLSKINGTAEFKGYQAVVSFSQAPDISDSIIGLQHSLLDALAAVLVMSAILIALRASLVTVSAMAVVLLSTLSVLYLIHYSLNTITLFSLILCLSLIVDDTIIMVEAIDAQRRKSKNPQEIIKKATKKISRAMVAATLTATIGFAPLIFVTGILGSFIRAIPITVITSLLVSLLVALTFIPFLSRFLLLRPKQLGVGEKEGESPSHHLEVFVARTISRPIMWVNHHRKRQFGLGIAALIVGFGFIVAGGLLFSKVTFNIFPPDKDSDFLTITLSFDPNSTIEQSEQTAEQADKVVARELGQNLKQSSYYDSGNAQNGMLNVNLISFKKRAITAPQMVTQLEKAFQGFQGATVKVGATGVGPNDSPFAVRIETDKRANAYEAAKSLQKFMSTKELSRLDGSKAHMKTVTISNPDVYLRDNSHAFVKVSSEFDGKDTSALVTLAQDAIKVAYNDKKMAQFGLKASNIVFDTGVEGDFQNSFKNLALAFPLLLVAIYILLATQFRSLLQPLLIFMAIPFSFFGITAGLWLTHNAFSFFTLLGFFALLGLSIKNTILLTDYANQARRAGSNAVEAVAISLQERFRPLVATSLAAIVSLIPLYLSNPFWEGLTVTLMFGLLSSTFLVITVFPYYYLGAEYLRQKIRRRAFGLWFVVSAIFVAALSAAGQSKAAPLGLLASLILVPLFFRYRRQRRA